MLDYYALRRRLRVRKKRVRARSLRTPGTCCPGSLSIYTNQDSDAAEILFEDNVWYDAATTLYVQANHAGATVITFSNNRNFDTFRIKIIVL